MQVTRFKERYMGELPQQMQANLATLEQLNGQLRLNNDSQVQVSERRAALAKQLQESEGGVVDGPRTAAERLAALHKQLGELRARFSDKYPDVIRVRTEIAALEREVKDGEGAPEPDRVRPVSPHVLQLRQALDEVGLQGGALRAEAESLRRTIALYQQRVENAPKREQEFQGLSRDYETGKDLYRSLLVRQKEAELAESMEQRQKGEQFRIIDPATVSEEPSAPNRGRLVLIGLVLALGAALTAMVVAEQNDTSFHAPEDLHAATRTPVLVSIPRIVTATDRRQLRWRYSLAAVSSVVSVGLIVGASYYMASHDGPLAGLLLRSGQ